jgi:hypothetical protein
MCFTIDEQTDKTLKDLPRSYKISEKLRGALKEILDKREKTAMKKES